MQLFMFVVTCYHKSLLSTISIFNCVVHGYAVHSVLASYIISIVHVVCMCKQEGGRNCVIL